MNEHSYFSGLGGRSQPGLTPGQNIIELFAAPNNCRPGLPYQTDRRFPAETLCLFTRLLICDNNNSELPLRESLIT
jgi:hypothetical protein